MNKANKGSFRVSENWKNKKDTIRYGIYKSSVGNIYIASTGKGICNIQFGKVSEKEFRKNLICIKPGVSLEFSQLPDKIIDEMKRYWKGEQVKFLSPIDILEGTDFQRAVWEEWRKYLTVQYVPIRILPL